MLKASLNSCCQTREHRPYILLCLEKAPACFRHNYCCLVWAPSPISEECRVPFSLSHRHPQISLISSPFSTPCLAKSRGILACSLHPRNDCDPRGDHRSKVWSPLGLEGSSNH